MRRAKVILCNLHATSRPVLVLPWLLAICLARGVDAVLLQECTARHAAWLRRLPHWDLVRTYGDEAILIRRKCAGRQVVIRSLTKRWFGRHTGDPHRPRTIPAVALGGWVWLGSVHLPPGWIDGPQDRQEAGDEYLLELGDFANTRRDIGPLFLGGDWNGPPFAEVLTGWRKSCDLDAHGWGIDHAAYRGVRVRGRVALGRGPGMDHGAWLYTIAEAAE